ncbi:hypothetical protein ELH93_28565 (plasmid) [Rhizobium leguminosarum]|uniref:Nmad2 family putative nucleotide modification protein n=1 Tax=Rhizobium leguminosarum TaxID=384 RepID=UPI001031FACC|nr:hypothetical protein [Rhizobium leguminosarum]TAY27683.1 hypothetical protein ELH93_28565 [Rhizobium leguminosarum]
MAVYMYVVARDFGFAPNPFHGYCTLATCKPRTRSVAQVGDWIIGMGGGQLGAVGRCIFAMQVSQVMSFNEYWDSPNFLSKRPVRNGSRCMMLGDNIYNRDSDGAWHQMDSHHSQPDGSPDPDNIRNDTQTNRVLISDRFFYFGKEAPEVPADILTKMGYRNLRNHRVFKDDECTVLLNWLLNGYSQHTNEIMGDPFQFEKSGARYSVKGDKVIV